MVCTCSSSWVQQAPPAGDHVILNVTFCIYIFLKRRVCAEDKVLSLGHEVFSLWAGVMFCL